VVDFDDEDGNTRNSNIERLLNLKYQFCRDLFSKDFLEANKIEPDWKGAMISGKEYYEGYLMKLGYKGNIPSSHDYTVYNIQRTSSKRQFKIFTCHFEGCSRVVSTLSKYFAHLRCHTQDKPYECQEVGCGMRFTQQGNLQKHLEIHYGIKKHVCHHCGNRYSKKFNLNVHLKSVESKEKKRLLK
jgi:hypothetical protein